jgi:hypothetical protein
MVLFSASWMSRTKTLFIGSKIYYSEWKILWREIFCHEFKFFYDSRRFFIFYTSLFNAIILSDIKHRL